MVSTDKYNAHILIVDDEPEIRNTVRAMLSESYRCRTTNSAEEALSILRTEKFELVMSDIKWDGMSGLEMIPRVKEIAPDTAVMMLSGEQTIESAIGFLILELLNRRQIWTAQKNDVRVYGLERRTGVVPRFSCPQQRSTDR